MDVFMRFMLMWLRILYWILCPLLVVFSWCRKKQRVPPANSKILNFSATILAAKIRKKELKCEDVIRAYISRIEEVNPIVNAVSESRFEEALGEAIEVDIYLQRKDLDLQLLELTQPLLGVPITVKETCGVKGMSQCVASMGRLNLKATDDGDAVKLVRQAGAIILLTSTTPEFSCYWEANTLVAGLTKNPYDTRYSPAGSSSGEGALLASQASVIGLGSDVAGSIRLPGLVNGIFGHKGTAGVVSTKGHFPAALTAEIDASLVIGPLTRFAEDLPLLFRVLRDPKYADINLDTKVDLCNVKVYSMHKFTWCPAQCPVDAEIKEAIEKSVKHLQEVCFSQICQYEFPMKNALEMTNSLLYYSGGLPNILENPNNEKDKGSVFKELLKKLLCFSKVSMHALIFESLSRSKGYILPHKTEKYLKELEQLKITFQEKLGDDGILLCPTFTENSFRNNEFLFKISGVQYLSIFNVLELPCTNVPLGLAKNKMPMGIQVVAGKNQDRLCFAVAKELEKAFGGWTEIC